LTRAGPAIWLVSRATASRFRFRWRRLIRIERIEIELLHARDSLNFPFGKRPHFANLLDEVETFVTLIFERTRLLCIIAICESGGIGRRTRLRIWRGNPWGFESPLSHQQLAVLPNFRCFGLCPILCLPEWIPLFRPDWIPPSSKRSLGQQREEQTPALSRPLAGGCNAVPPVSELSWVEALQVRKVILQAQEKKGQNVDGIGGRRKKVRPP
jgi:hypothetical protein